MRCISRVLFGGEEPLVFGEVFFLRCVVLSVGVAVVFIGTYLDLAVLYVLNLNFS